MKLEIFASCANTEHVVPIEFVTEAPEMKFIAKWPLLLFISFLASDSVFGLNIHQMLDDLRLCEPELTFTSVALIGSNATDDETILENVSLFANESDEFIKANKRSDLRSSKCVSLILIFTNWMPLMNLCWQSKMS